MKIASLFESIYTAHWDIFRAGDDPSVTQYHFIDPKMTESRFSRLLDDEREKEIRHWCQTQQQLKKWGEADI